MSITIREVAQQAGVSIATVSRVLSGGGPVSEQTRRRIERVARELRYAPNQAARSLITSRTHTLGALLPDLFGEFFSEVLRSLDTAAQAAGHQLLVSSSHHDRTGVTRALQAMRGRVDGLVVMAPDLDAALLRDNLPADVRVVLLNTTVEGAPYDVLALANYDGARAALAHLAGRGHRRIAHVTGPLRNFDAAERRRGYADALAAHGLDADPALVVEGDFSDASGYAAVQRLVAGGAAFSALFAANDAMAVGAIGALREAGRAVPGDVAVVGFDDIPMARYFSPPLTSVRAPLAQMGADAVRQLLHPDAAPRHTVLPTELVVRASSEPS